jgi:hypothetical protein
MSWSKRQNIETAKHAAQIAGSIGNIKIQSCVAGDPLIYLRKVNINTDELCVGHQPWCRDKIVARRAAQLQKSAALNGRRLQLEDLPKHRLPVVVGVSNG